MAEETKDEQFRLSELETVINQVKETADLTGDNSIFEDSSYKDKLVEYETLKSKFEGGSSKQKNQKAQELIEDEEEVENEDEEKKSPVSKQKNASKKNEEPTQEDQDEEEDEEEEDKRDVLGILKKTKSSTANQNFDSIDDLKAFIEKRYAIKDLNTHFKSVDKWRNDAQEYSKLKEDHEELLKGFSMLPPQIAQAINDFSEGRDWKSSLSAERIDYNKTFKEQKRDAVLNYYFANKYKSLEDKLNNEQITEEDYEERIGDLLESAERLYETDKRSFELKRVELERNAENAAKALKESAVNSVEKLQEKFDLKPGELQRVRQVLVNGDIESLFKDKNGKYTEQAATRIALALHGETIIQMLIDRAEAKGRNKATEEHVFNAEKKANVKTGRNDSPDKKQQINAINHLDGMFEQDAYA